MDTNIYFSQGEKRTTVFLRAEQLKWVRDRRINLSGLLRHTISQMMSDYEGDTSRASEKKHLKQAIGVNKKSFKKLREVLNPNEFDKFLESL